MLFIVREANLDLTLVAETLYSSRADLISRQLLEPVKALGFRIRAVVSDADKNIRRAVECRVVLSRLAKCIACATLANLFMKRIGR